MNSRLYVGRLSYRVRERDLERFFKNYGRVNEIMLKNGYAFVEFEDSRDAEDAAIELNGRELCGERVVVEVAKGTPHGRDAWKDRERGIEYSGSSRRENRYDERDRYGDRNKTYDRSSSKYGYRCVIENLSSRATKYDIKDLLRKMGEIGSIEIHSDYAVVEFLSSRDMKYAIDKLYGTDFFGRKIKLFEEKDEKSGSRRSRRRSNSGVAEANKSSVSRSRTASRSRSPKRRSSKRTSKSRSHSPIASVDKRTNRDNNNHGDDHIASPKHHEGADRYEEDERMENGRDHVVHRGTERSYSRSL